MANNFNHLPHRYNPVNNKRIIIIASALVAFVLIGAALYIYRVTSSLEAEKEAIISQQSEVMQEELASLSEEYDQQYKLIVESQERRFILTSDSLLDQLTQERNKVEELMKELKSTKASSAKRIAELTREIASLRKILRSYVVQIDSLHTLNERLQAENQDVRQQYQRASNEAQQLASERSALSERVQLAAKLDATNIIIQAIDKRGKRARSIDRTEHIQISFKVSKNVTASVGKKIFYTRIMRPDDEVMTKKGGGTFEFEGKHIAYSTRKEIEYNGEETSVQMYWPVEESLQSGIYRIMIFADGNLIGSGSLTL